MESASDQQFRRATYLTDVTFALPYILLATIGNILSFKVMSLAKNSSSTTVYLRTLAAADSLAVDIPLFLVFLESVTLQPIRSSTDAACKLLPFVSYTIGDVAIWIVPLLSLDRVMALFLPTRNRQYCNPRTAKIALTSLFCIAVVKNSTNLVVNAAVGGIDADGNNTSAMNSSCGVYPGMETFNFGCTIFAMVVVAYVPVTAVIVMNTMIVIGIRARLSQGQVQSSSGATFKALRNSIRLTLAVSIAYVLFLLPYFTYIVIPASLLGVSPAVEAFIATLLNHVMFLNHACNFILYVMVSPTFRRDLRLVLACRRANNRVANGGANVAVVEATSRLA